MAKVFNRTTKMLNYKEIAKIHSIPYPTFLDWTTKNPQAWRGKLAKFLSAITADEAAAIKERAAQKVSFYATRKETAIEHGMPYSTFNDWANSNITWRLELSGFLMAISPEEATAIRGRITQIGCDEPPTCVLVK